MTLQGKRRIALGAVRSEMRSNSIEPASKTADEALAVLDDIARTEPELVASDWYLNASPNQIRLFKRQWR